MQTTDKYQPENASQFIVRGDIQSLWHTIQRSTEQDIANALAKAALPESLIMTTLDQLSWLSVTSPNRHRVETIRNLITRQRHPRSEIVG